MPNDSHRPDVAVFIDFENVYVSVRDKLDANPNFEMIMDRCEDLGRVVIARAYADWYRYPRVTSALYANGIEPMYVPTYYYDREMGRTGRAIKNSVDMNLCIDAMKTLFTNTNIAKFVLATGDRDFIPLVNSIRQQGKEVIIIGIGGAASSHLAQSADEFIFYESLVGKKPAELLPDQPKAKMPDKGREQAEAEEEQPPARPREAPALPTPSTQPDVYDTLVSAINLARERGYVCSFGSLKLLMKELMGGDFKEGRYKDSAGKPFAKFKDFVLEAERRGKVQVFTSGTVNEVFLPGEDPYKLSQFAQELKEEPPPLIPAAPLDSRTDGRGGVSNNGRRRRRRSRGGQRSPRPEELALPEELAEEETEEDEVEEIEYALPEEVIVPDLIDDTSVEFREDFYPEVSEESELSEIEPESPVLDEAQAEAVFEELLDRVEEEEAESQARAALDPLEIIELPALPRELEAVPEAQPAAETGAITPPAEVQPAAETGAITPPTEAQPVESQPFVEEEWRLLREIVARYDRPISFAQIHDAMRDARNNSGITRTNEELRTLIKQAINRGMLERSGRGNRVTYRLAPQLEGSGPATSETIEASEQEIIEASEPAAPEVAEAPVETSEPLFHTPEAAAQAELVEVVPEAEAPPVVISADEPAAPGPKKPSRPRRKSAAAPEAPATPAQPPRTGSRRKPAANAEPAAPAEAAAPRRSRTRKTEAAAPPAEAAPARRSRRKKTEET